MTEPLATRLPEHLTVEDVQSVAEWGSEHPVIGPLARTALLWKEQAERAKAAADEWRDEAKRLGWRP